MSGLPSTAADAEVQKGEGPGPGPQGQWHVQVPAGLAELLPGATLPPPKDLRALPREQP